MKIRGAADDRARDDVNDLTRTLLRLVFLLTIVLITVAELRALL